MIADRILTAIDLDSFIIDLLIQKSIKIYKNERSMLNLTIVFFISGQRLAPSNGRYARLLSEDAALKEYNKDYKTYYTRLRRGSMTEAVFAAWRDEALDRQERTRSGEYSLAEYVLL